MKICNLNEKGMHYLSCIKYVSQHRELNQGLHDHKPASLKSDFPLLSNWERGRMEIEQERGAEI